MRNEMRSVIFSAIVIVAMFLMCSCRPYMEPIFSDVGASETAFVIPLEGSSNDTKKIGSIEACESYRVMKKRIEISQRWLQTGRWGWYGKYIPTVDVIRVNRAPITREWAQDGTKKGEKDQDAIWIESADSIGFSVGFNCTGYIKEEDAAKFLYMYASSSLAEVMDKEVRGRVQQIAAEIAAKYPLDTLRAKKQEIVDAIRLDVIPFFEKRGITITSIGMFGGFTYENIKIQDSIDQVFVAQQAKAQEFALLEAMTSNKQRMLAEGEAHANKAREQSRGVADAKLIEAEAEAKSIQLVVNALKEAQNSPAFIEIKQLEVRRVEIEKWNGVLPTVTAGSGTLPVINVSK